MRINTIMDLQLDGKTAIITGGSKGIGKGIGEALAAEGCNLVICARHQDELQAAADDLESRGVQVEPVVADLTDASDVDKVINVATDRFGPIDILINNAETAGHNVYLDEKTLEA